MASYSQPTDVRIAALPSSDGSQATGSNTAADLADPQLNDAIAEADAQIDAYIGGSYTGNDTVPPIVKYWSRDIALYLATLTMKESLDMAPDDPVRLRYVNAINALGGGAGKSVAPTSAPSTDSASIAVADVVPFALFNESYDRWCN